MLQLVVKCTHDVAVRWPATSWVNFTTSCNTQSSTPEDGQNNCPKHVELIGVINKPLLFLLVGVYIIYINDARSNKYQMPSLVVRTLDKCEADDLCKTGDKGKTTKKVECHLCILFI